MTARRARGMARALALALALVCAARPAHAADPSPDDPKEQARALATRGDAEFANGRCDRAVPLWQEAAARFAAPTILLRIARCQALLGHVVDATATLQLIVDRDLGPDAPEPFVQAREEARRALPRVRARAAYIRVDVTGTDASGASVQVDDTPVTASQQEAVDPGAHTVRVRAGTATWESNVVLDEGQSRAVSVRLLSLQPPPQTSAQVKVGYVLGGSGLLALVVGGVLGATALSTASTLSSTCGSDRVHCPTQEQSDIDGLRTRSLLADLFLGGGGALLAAGAIVTLSAPPAAEAPTRLEIVPTLAGLALRGPF